MNADRKRKPSETDHPPDPDRAAIRLRACMRIGELSMVMESKQGTRDAMTGRLVPTDGKKETALTEAGLSTSTANRYEQLAGSEGTTPEARDKRRAVDIALNDPEWSPCLIGAIRPDAAIMR